MLELDRLEELDEKVDPVPTGPRRLDEFDEIAEVLRPAPEEAVEEVTPVASGTEVLELETPELVLLYESAAATALGGREAGGSNSRAPLGSFQGAQPTPAGPTTIVTGLLPGVSVVVVVIVSVSVV